MVLNWKEERWLVCKNCGMKINSDKYPVSYWIRQFGTYPCPACTSKNQWVRVRNAKPSELNNELWKKLIYVNHHEKFKPGRPKLKRKYRKVYDNADALSDKEKKAVLDYVGGDVRQVEEDE